MGKDIRISANDLYHFLICECRYGYTRNNHLMPSFAFDHCKEFLPLMLTSDKDWALQTAKQLCDECISLNIINNYYDGVDDESKNRNQSKEFVYWLLDFINSNSTERYYPYNYSSFLENLSKDDEPRYIVKELLGFDKNTNQWKDEKVLNDGNLLSKNNYFDFIVREVYGDTEHQSIFFNEFELSSDRYFRKKSNKIVYCIHSNPTRVFLVERTTVRRDNVNE